MELKELTARTLKLFYISSVSDLGKALMEHLNDTDSMSEFKAMVDDDLTKDWLQMVYQCLDAITSHKSIVGFSQVATIENIKAQDFCISPIRYVKSEPVEVRHRAYQDIAADYNRTVRMKNAVRITLNRTAAKRLGLDPSLYENDIDISPSFKLVGCEAEKDNFVHFSANDGIRIECSTKEGDIPIMISDFIRSWTQYIRMLNNESNRYLAEFRDALLPDLMSGKIKVYDD